MPNTQFSHRIAAALLIAFSGGDAQAYLDPNAGGLLYQVLLPVIVAVTAGWRYIRVVCSSLWQRLTCRGRSAKQARDGQGSGRDVGQP